MAIVYPGIQLDQGINQSPVYRRTPFRTQQIYIGKAIKLADCILPTENLMTTPSLNMAQRRASARINCDIHAFMLDRQLPVVLSDDSITVGYIDHIPMETGGGSGTEEVLAPDAYAYIDISNTTGSIIWSDCDIIVWLYDLDFPFTVTRAYFIKSKYEGVVTIDYRATLLKQMAIRNMSQADGKIHVENEYVISL